MTYITHSNKMQQVTRAARLNWALKATLEQDLHTLWRAKYKNTYIRRLKRNTVYYSRCVHLATHEESVILEENVV